MPAIPDQARSRLAKSGKCDSLHTINDQLRTRCLVNVTVYTRYPMDLAVVVHPTAVAVKEVKGFVTTY